MLQHHAALSISEEPIPVSHVPGICTPGLPVLFVPNALDCDAITRLPGPGNAPRVGDLLPAVIVKVWQADEGYVNLKVLTDAASDYWATSVSYSPPFQQEGLWYVRLRTWFTVRELPLLKAPEHSGRQAMDEAAATGRTG